MFEVNGTYINRRGKYTVLSLNPPKMQVRYEDGEAAELKIAIQARIWENILVEQEAAAARRSARSAQAAGGSKTQYFIKAVTVPSPSEFAFAGWSERVLMAKESEADMLQPGDRIIYYALETQTFVAVATITGAPKTADPKDFFYTTDLEMACFFPIDVDAASVKLSTGVTDDSIELESQPNFRKLKLAPEDFLKINEDDFELLAEILTEIAESDEDEEIEEEEFEEEDED